MPYLKFGENLPSEGSKFTRLKNSGDKLKFRIIGDVFAEGNHFFNEDGKWNIVPCARINDRDNCEHCKTFFKAMKSIPKTEDKEEYKKLADAMKKTVPGCEPSISYNFPIINRDTHEFTIFQATTGIRNKVEAEFALGTKILSVDFIAMNTGKKGKDRYALSRVDSKDTPDLTENEIKLIEDFEDGKFGEMGSEKDLSKEEDQVEDLEV